MEKLAAGEGIEPAIRQNPEIRKPASVRRCSMFGAALPGPLCAKTRRHLARRGPLRVRVLEPVATEGLTEGYATARDLGLRGHAAALDELNWLAPIHRPFRSRGIPEQPPWTPDTRANRNNLVAPVREPCTTTRIARLPARPTD